MSAVETIRAALEKWHKAKTMQEACEADDEYGDATDQDVMADVLAHIDAQAAEIAGLEADAAEHLAELRAYELTVANLREQLAQRGEPIARLSVDPYAGVFFHLLVDAPEGTHDLFTHPQASQAQRGEPVAWKWRFADGDLSESPFESRSECERDAVGYDGEAIPLYTHPQTPQVQMTLDEILGLGNVPFALDDSQLTNIVRAVEAHHGIKEQP